MKTGIITIGNELLTGFIDDTNAAWLGRQMTEIGCAPVWHLSVGDDLQAITNALSSVPDDVTEIIITGGLGPTHDDISLSAVSGYFALELVADPAYWDELTERFRRRGFKIGNINRNQSLVVQGAEVIPNPVGSARGTVFSRGEQHFYLLPGVPAEMKAMFRQTILPRLNTKGHSGFQVVIRTTGIIESALAERLGNLYLDFPTVKQAYLPRLGGVDIRLISHEKVLLEEFKTRILDRIGRVCYGFGTIELEEVVGRLLTEQGQTIATAESCTGGLVSHRLTQVAGSSVYLVGGIVAYSNAVKMSLLSVPQDTLAKYGAVSEQTARIMAEGVRKNLGADIGVSTTGIAGPGGGTPEKPVGLIYVGFASAERSFARKFSFIYNRQNNKRHSSQVALNIVRLELENA